MCPHDGGSKDCCCTECETHSCRCAYWVSRGLVGWMRWVEKVREMEVAVGFMYGRGQVEVELPGRSEPRDWSRQFNSSKLQETLEDTCLLLHLPPLRLLCLSDNFKPINCLLRQLDCHVVVVTNTVKSSAASSERLLPTHRMACEAFSKLLFYLHLTSTY